jgi:hypothetical protein
LFTTFEYDQVDFRKEISILDQISDDQEKIDEYLRVIHERILTPIQTTAVRRYSTATLLLLFAAIDGVGKLLHHNSSAGSNQRILRFLDYMGGGYSTHKKELLRLRNSLVHNAINVASFLSRTETGHDLHLRKVGADDFIHVNTVAMYEDVARAIERFHTQIQIDTAMMKRAADRLEWRETADRLEGVDENLSAVTPTPPTPVEFIIAK